MKISVEQEMRVAVSHPIPSFVELNRGTHPIRKPLFKKEMKILFLKFIHLLFTQMATKLLGHKVLSYLDPAA